MSSTKDWLKDIFVSLPHVAEKILDELIRAENDFKRQVVFDTYWFDGKNWRSQQESWKVGNSTDGGDETDDDELANVQENQEQKELIKWGSWVFVLPLRLVCRDLKNMVDNYEKVWYGFDWEQPLLYPTLLGRIDIIERLLAKGVKVNDRGAALRWGFNSYWCPEYPQIQPPSPLDLAAKYGCVDSAKVLIENNAELVSKSPVAGSWDVPLHHAARAGQIGMIELLLTKGVNIHRVGFHNDYPLSCAVKGGHKDAVDLLIRSGADVNFEWWSEWHGLTLLDCAMLEGREEIAMLIEAHGGESKHKQVILDMKTCEDCQKTKKSRRLRSRFFGSWEMYCFNRHRQVHKKDLETEKRFWKQIPIEDWETESETEEEGSPNPPTESFVLKAVGLLE